VDDPPDFKFRVFSFFGSAECADSQRGHRTGHPISQLPGLVYDDLLPIVVSPSKDDRRFADRRAGGPEDPPRGEKRRAGIPEIVVIVGMAFQRSSNG